MPNSSDVLNGPLFQDRYKFHQACKRDAIYCGQFRAHNRGIHILIGADDLSQSGAKKEQKNLAVVLNR
jgi:hypothetical protein